MPFGRTTGPDTVARAGPVVPAAGAADVAAGSVVAAGVFVALRCCDGHGGAGVAVGAATTAAVAVARYRSGALDVIDACPWRARAFRAFPTAPEDRFSACAISRGVRSRPKLSARTLATIARSSPLRNRDTDALAAGAVGAAVGEVAVVGGGVGEVISSVLSMPYGTRLRICCCALFGIRSAASGVRSPDMARAGGGIRWISIPAIIQLSLCLTC